MPALLRPAGASIVLLLLAALARAATTPWAGQPLTAILEALRATGVEVAYSNELVPTTLRIGIEPTGETMQQRTERALAEFHLRLHPVAGNRYVVDRDETAAARDPAPDASATPVDTASAPLDEVLVYADREAADFEQRSLNSRRLRAMPGTEDDALGELRMLPGIAADTSARPYVRGSSQEDVLIVFDHVPIPDPFHLRNYGNLASVFDVSVIDRIDLYSGGFPVRYGTRSGGVVELTPHQSDSARELLLGASLSGLRATTAGHTDAGVEWLAAARQSLDGRRWLSAGDPLSQPVALDGVARVHWHGGGSRVWTMGGLSLDDHLNLQNPTATERVNAVSSSQNVWLTLETGEASGWSTRTTVIGSHGRSRRSGDADRPGLLQGTLDDRRDLDGLALQHETMLTRAAGDRWDWGAELSTTGGDARYLRNMQYDPQALRDLSLDPLPDAAVSASLRSLSYAAFAAYTRAFGAHLNAELGLRYDRQRYPHLTPFEEWSPRLNLRYRVTPALTIYSSVGKYTQAQRPDERRFEESQYTPDHPQVNWQETLGMDFQRQQGPIWRIEVYHKHWDRISPYFDNLINDRGLLPELAPLRVLIAPRSAVAQGAEISVRSAPSRPWQYWVSYTYANVQDLVGQSAVSRSWDQRSALSSGLMATHRALRGTAVLRWHSGTPSTAIGMLPPPVGGAPQLLIGARNSGRSSDFISLDLRAAWTHGLRAGELELWTEVTNALNRPDSCCTAPGVAALASGAGNGTSRSVNLGALVRFH